ncbi:MAG TPA: type I-B CRISPR-associated protein Cas8b1/Cst1 [Thermotogaceae bacterium]|nr:type I-B CRISPR-associated protein Cas8b1/Cst1 [Thermotogaceae bacterium]
MKFYPGPWFYNAAIIGFANSVSKYFGNRSVEYLDDGTLEIEDKVMSLLRKPVWEVIDNLPKSLQPPSTSGKGQDFIEEAPVNAWMFILETIEFLKQPGNAGKNFLKKIKNAEKHRDPFELFQIVRSRYFLKSGPFANAISAGNKEENVIGLVTKLFCGKEETIDERVHCSLCGKEFNVPKDPDRMFMDNRILKYAASSKDKFPGFHWGFKPSIPICPECLSILFYGLLAFVRGPTGKYLFINAHSFKLMKELHKELKEIATKRSVESPSKVFIQSVLKQLFLIATSFSLWSTLTIEMYQITSDFSRSSVTYIPPHKIEQLLGSEEISNALMAMHSTEIFEHFIQNDIGWLFNLLYLLTKYIISHGKGSIEELYSYIGSKNMEHASYLMNDLQVLICGMLYNGGGQMDLWKVKKAAMSLPPKLKEDLAKLSYQILEKTRTGSKDDALYLIERTFAAHKTILTDEIIDIFDEKNDETFKLKLYTFIGRIFEKSEKGGEEE